MKLFIENLFAIPGVRYVSVYRNNELISEQSPQLINASSAESDRYEELLVNPTLLKLAEQRGNIDCGGLDYILVKYGHFYQFIRNITGGHISICLDEEKDPLNLIKLLNPEIDTWEKTGVE